MTEIILGEHDQVMTALKIFRRQVQRAGILKDLRAKRFYVKPSAAKRKKAQAASRRRATRRHRD
jgi:small subunit ribosomal protein S21